MSVIQTSWDLGQPSSGADPNRLMVLGISWKRFLAFFFSLLISLVL